MLNVGEDDRDSIAIYTPISNRIATRAENL